MPVLYKVRVGLIKWGLVDTQDIVGIAEMCFSVDQFICTFGNVFKAVVIL